jgi:hypothetical protein
MARSRLDPAAVRFQQTIRFLKTHGDKKIGQGEAKQVAAKMLKTVRESKREDIGYQLTDVLFEQSPKYVDEPARKTLSDATIKVTQMSTQRRLNAASSAAAKFRSGMIAFKKENPALWRASPLSAIQFKDFDPKTGRPTRYTDGDLGPWTKDSTFKADPWVGVHEGIYVFPSLKLKRGTDASVIAENGQVFKNHQFWASFKALAKDLQQDGKLSARDAHYLRNEDVDQH